MNEASKEIVGIPLNGFSHVTTIHLESQTFFRTIRMTMSMAGLLDDFGSNRFLIADYWPVDYAYCHAVDCYLALIPDAYANALGSAYFHYFPFSAFLNRLKMKQSASYAFENVMFDLVQ